MTTANAGSFPISAQADARILSGAAKKVPIANAGAGSDNKSPANSGTGVAETDWFDPPLRGFVVTGAGNVCFILHGDDADDLTSAATITRTYVAGEVEGRFLVRRILATGTTATGVIGLR